MTPIASSTLLIVALVACGCDSRGSKPSNVQNRDANLGDSFMTDSLPSPQPNNMRRAGIYAGEWSESVNGLSARLLVTLTKSGNSPALFATPVILEVRNTDGSPLAFTDQPSFTGQVVRDAQGNALPESVAAGNHLRGVPQWAAIPGNAYLGLRVDTSVPTDVGLWYGLIAPEAQSLTATLVAQRREGPANQWIGEIPLPPVSLMPKATGP